MKSKKTGTGSPEKPSEANRQQGGLSITGQQVLVALLSREQVAARWNCCPHTVARRKDLKPLRLGRRLLRYRLCDVEAIEFAANIL